MKNETQLKKVIDWRRIEVSLRQRFRRERVAQIRIPNVMEYLKKIADTTGKMSVNRRNLRHIGVSLAVCNKILPIISPICLSIPPTIPARVEVSELVKRHVSFLQGLGDALPAWHLTCLFPPPERDDEAAMQYIHDVYEITSSYYQDTDSRISCKMMIDYAPGMIVAEEIAIEEIFQNRKLSKLCEALIHQRSDYYRSLGIDIGLWPRKNRRTMAQYIILGRLAALHGALMCNHTTANIQCAVYAGAGVLHNPVGFRL